MNDQMLRDLLRRVTALERQAPRLRVGEVTDDSPLSVALGGSDVAYTDVKSIQSVTLGDTVAVLVAGHDLLVLGTIT